MPAQAQKELSQSRQAKYMRRVRQERKADNKCRECGVSISYMHATAKYCKECAELVRSRKTSEAYHRKKAGSPVTKPRLCGECKADISYRWDSAKYCEPCAKVVARRVYNNARRKLRALRRKAGKETLERLCRECKTDISHRLYQAKFCEKCAKARARSQQKSLQAKQQNKVKAKYSVTLKPKPALVEKPQPRPVYVDPKLAEYVTTAKCPKSPTGAHHRVCYQVRIEAVGHSHEKQECRYCGHVQWTPCYFCNREMLLAKRNERNKSNDRTINARKSAS